jgi:hypothetical protein
MATAPSLPNVVKGWNMLFSIKLSNYNWKLWEKDQRYQWTINDNGSYHTSVVPTAAVDRVMRSWQPPDTQHNEFNTVGKLIQDLMICSETQGGFSREIYLKFAEGIRKELL